MWVCEFVGLWVRVLCVFRFVGLWVCGFVRVFACLFVFACRVFLCSSVVECECVIVDLWVRASGFRASGL